MESVEIPVGACSGCAGDYEDPDRTAWEPHEDEDDEDRPKAEFPVPGGAAGEEAV